MDGLRAGLVAIAATLVALLLLYAMAYLALVRAEPLPIMTGVGPWERVPTYRAGGRTAEFMFAPIQAVDRRVRNRHWLYTDEDFDTGR